MMEGWVRQSNVTRKCITTVVCRRHFYPKGVTEKAVEKFLGVPSLKSTCGPVAFYPYFPGKRIVKPEMVVMQLKEALVL